VSYVAANGMAPVNYAYSGTRYGVVSPSEAQAGDYYSFRTSATDFLNRTAHQQVMVSGTTLVAGPLTLDLPDPMKYFAPAPAKFPHFTIYYPGFSSDAAISYIAQISNSGIATIGGITLGATSSYQDGYDGHDSGLDCASRICSCRE
jgi:hypothetical protein